MTIHDLLSDAAIQGVRLGRHLRKARSGSQVSEPPATPPGLMTGPPDFVGVGAPGSSTGWWLELMERHPQIVRAPGRARDLRYFDNFWERPFRPEDASRYERFFPRPRGCLAGEWTASYLHDFWTLDLIARAAPEARILLLLRDPVERYLTSGPRASRPSGGPGAWDDRGAVGAFQRGIYSDGIRRLLALFRADRVLVLQEEACRAAPAVQLRRTWAFLGLPMGTVAEASDIPVVPRGASRDARSALRTTLTGAYAPEIELLAQLVPYLDLSLWPAARGGRAADDG